MTSVLKAFERWMAAEADVHDANLVLLYEARRRGGVQSQVEQAELVLELREDASRLLREYLAAVEKEAARLSMPRQRPTPLQVVAYAKLPSGE